MYDKYNCYVRYIHDIKAGSGICNFNLTYLICANIVIMFIGYFSIKSVVNSIKSAFVQYDKLSS